MPADPGAIAVNVHLQGSWGSTDPVKRVVS